VNIYEVKERELLGHRERRKKGDMPDYSGI